LIVVIAFRPLQDGVLIELPFDEFPQLAAGHFEQLERSAQLRRHGQGLALAVREALA
jgi:hypothetical protein